VRQDFPFWLVRPRGCSGALGAPDLPQDIDQRHDERIGLAVRGVDEPQLRRDLRARPDHAVVGADGVADDFIADKTDADA